MNTTGTREQLDERWRCPVIAISRDLITPRQPPERIRRTGQTLSVVALLLAWTSSWGANWAIGLTPSQVITANTGGPYTQILTVDPIVNPAGCIADSYIIRDSTIVASSLATALAALASGRQIRVWVTDTCDSVLSRPLVTAVGMM